MSIQVAQISKNTFDNYSKTIDYIVKQILATTITVSTTIIDTKQVILRCNNTSKFKAGQAYCFKNLKLSIKNYYYGAKVKIKLANSLAGNSSDGQIIQIVNIPQVNFTLETLAFIPKQDYEFITFEIQRTDLEMYKSNVYVDININNAQFFEIRNILDNLKSNFNIKLLKEIGIQGRPGFQFMINGELIKLGKSGIYTLSDIDFSSLGFIIYDNIIAINPDTPTPLNEDAVYFLMDFVYEKEEEEKNG